MSANDHSNGKNGNGANGTGANGNGGNGNGSNGNGSNGRKGSGHKGSSAMKAALPIGNGKGEVGIAAHISSASAPLEASQLFDGVRLVILGGTGFLGKIFWLMLLDRYPNVGKIFLLVRGSKESSSAERFWKTIVPSEAFAPLRERYGDEFESFLREKIVPIDGDMGRPSCGIDEKLVRELKGTIDAVINVAGVVDFNPPLDEALDANAFGSQNLVALAKALGDVPIMHTSTCFVGGNREGTIYEDDPLAVPFPRFEELGSELWDPDREIAECLDIIAQAKHRCDDAFRESEFLEKAKNTLKDRGEPTYGKALDSEMARVRRKFVSEKLVEAGVDRASHWGWPNIYTYTKSIGEQVVARSGLPFTIVRPASCESTMAFPFPGWNEGIGTSAPFIYLAMKGQVQFPATNVVLDFIPSDLVCIGMIISLAELLEGSAKPVYQFGASDSNPCSARRFCELMGLYKRKAFLRKSDGNPFVNVLQAYFEPIGVDEKQLNRLGPKALARVTGELSSLMRKAAVGPAAAVLKPMSDSLKALSEQEKKIGELLDVFAPFTTYQRGPFSSANTRAAFHRLAEEDRNKLGWHPEKIDWADYWHTIHMPAMEKRVIPYMDQRYAREKKPLRAHATLVSLVSEMAERHEHAPAFQMLERDGLSRVTYADVAVRSRAVASRLRNAGIGKGDTVVLSALNHPDWAIAYFGILTAGAVAVPVDPNIDREPFANIVRESQARVAIIDEHVFEKTAKNLGGQAPKLRLEQLRSVTQPLEGVQGEEGDVTWPVNEIAEVADSDIASLIFTSGTTGTPKGVKLTHANFAALIAALAPVFPLKTKDTVLSVLPLHHTFEFTCGLLLPFSRGSRIVYIGEITSERLQDGLARAKPTAMVGVPALWQLLERRILAQVKNKGPIAEAVFGMGGKVNRMLAKNVGLDAGKLLFGQVHNALGGNIRYLISGGAALPESTHKLFQSVGLNLAEGYGLTEASPVLTVSESSPKARAGQVGKAIPGVQIKIAHPDQDGVGEVWAKSPGVMAGYTDEEATREVIDADGWLHTGDLGKLGKDGRLEIVGRLKDVIVTTTGENVYPDDVERRIGEVSYIDELAICAVGSRGSERIGCLASPKADESVSRKERNDRALRSLKQVLGELPVGMRPSVVHLYEAPLPRTATRKVKRNDVRAILNRFAAATVKVDVDDKSVTPVRVAIAALRGKKTEDVRGAMTLAGDLGLDSLALTELLGALETKFGAIEPSALAGCETVADVESLVGVLGSVIPPASVRDSSVVTRSSKTIEKGEERVVLPPVFQDYGRKALGKMQDAFYSQAMSAKVYGRAFIPQNRHTIVVANHASHLDMGFVRHALGKYGEDIVSLAAQDYFFDKDKWRRAFFENFTNLKAIDRKSTLRQAERQAAEVIESGKTMLIFPEGTRSPNGEIQEFKPLIGHLALTYGVDILPLHLSGTREALPKGSVLLPRRRDITARIGPALRVEDLRRLTEGMSRADASREVARIAREAVLALRDRGVLDLAKAKTGESVAAEREHPLVEVFAELETKFKPESVKKPISFYFTLGGDAMAKWTVRIEPTKCEIKIGKPETGNADCVLKTTAEMFTKIVRESYTPGPTEFMSGLIKSNDVELLQQFQKAFQLA